MRTRPRPASPPPIPALPTLSPSLLGGVARPPAFPFDRLAAARHAPADAATARLYYLARNGICHGLRALGLGPGDVVLLPAYHHGVEVEAVRHAGPAVAFYRVDRSLAVDLDDLARRAAAPRVRAVYLTHTAGFAQPVDDVAALCRARDLVLVEDSALALYSRDRRGRWLGQTGDLAVFCLYKTLPVPHGGVALCRVPLPGGAPPPLWSTMHHVAGSLLGHAARRGPAARRLTHAVRALGRRSIDRAVRHEQVGTQHFDPAQLRLGASPLVLRIAAAIDPEQVAALRRRNFFRLLCALGDDAHVPTGAPPPGCAPLFLPLGVPPEARRPVLEALWSRGVEAVDFWSIGDPACTDADFPDAAALRRTVIELPIHQGLGEDDIDRVALALKEALGAAMPGRSARAGRAAAARSGS